MRTMLAVLLLVGTLAGSTSASAQTTRLPQGESTWSIPQPASKATTPKALRPCRSYGEGFYYVPGTETCIKFSGYGQTDISIPTH